MARMRVVTVAIFACLVLALFAGCFVKVGGSVGVPVEEKGRIAIFNRVDELLEGDLADTVSLEELESRYEGKEIVGLGTTSREHCGEIIFSSGDCYWADPTNQGRVVELGWSEEKLPFCAVVTIDEASGQTFSGVSGDLHTFVESKAKELGIPLAAVKVGGRFTNVSLSIADKLPTNTGEKLKGVTVPVIEERQWELVGFYALTGDEQELISTEGHPVHLHGIVADNSHGGHLVQANSVNSEVTIYPVQEYILRNRVPW